MTNRHSIAKDLFPDSMAVDLSGSATLSTSTFTEIQNIDTSSVSSPSGKVFVSSSSATDDVGISTSTEGYNEVDFGGTIVGSTVISTLGISATTYYVSSTTGAKPLVQGDDLAVPFDGSYGFSPSSTVEDVLAFFTANDPGATWTIVNGDIRVTSKNPAGPSSCLQLFTPNGTGFFESMTGFVKYKDPVDGETVITGGTGARSIEIKGITIDGKKSKENILLDGQTQVESALEYSSIISAKVLTAGSNNTNAGEIYIGSSGAVSGKPNVGYLMIPVGYNTQQTTSFTVPSTYDGSIEHIEFFNPTPSEVLTIRLCDDYLVLKEFKVGAGQTSIEFTYPIQANGRVTLQAKSTSTTPSVTASIAGVLVKRS